MKSVNELTEYLQNLNSQHQTALQKPKDNIVSERVVLLAENITRWHAERKAPERWQPVQLGRLAAMLCESREITAATLIYIGWKEKKVAKASLWSPYQ